MGPFVVQVWDEAGTVAASGVGMLVNEETTFTLPLVSRSHEFLVLDEVGSPVAGAEVHIASPAQAPGWFTSAATEVNGVATIWILPCELIVASAVHPEAGRVFDIQVDLETEGPSTELILERSEVLRAQVSSANGPAAGVAVSLLAAGGTYIVANVVTDPKGRIELEAALDALPEFVPTHPAYWPVTRVSTPQSSWDAIAVRAYGLAALEIQVQSPGGAPVVDLHVQLGHVDLKESVDEWLARGLLPVSTTAATDSQGSLRIDGIPEGLYRWQAQTSDGGLRTGEFELVAPELRVVKIVL
jgi:hypothetical protein